MARDLPDHNTIRICAEHKAVQLRCKCPEPITKAIEEECRHGDLTEGRHLYWDDATKQVVAITACCPQCGSSDRTHVPQHFRTKGPFCRDDWHFPR